MVKKISIWSALINSSNYWWWCKHIKYTKSPLALQPSYLLKGKQSPKFGHLDKNITCCFLLVGQTPPKLRYLRGRIEEWECREIQGIHAKFGSASYWFVLDCITYLSFIRYSLSTYSARGWTRHYDKIKALRVV